MDKKIKCITFDKDAQDALPEDIKAKMKADREEARLKMEREKDKFYVVLEMLKKAGIKDVDSTKLIVLTGGNRTTP